MGAAEQREEGIRYTVEAAMPLLEWLTLPARGYGKTTARNLLRHGAVAVNGKPVNKTTVALKPGDAVVIARRVGGGGRAVAAARSAGMSKGRLPFPVLLEDEHFIAIDKPAGLLTIGSDDERARTAHRLLGNALGGRVFIVHRLDRGTSGVLLFAKSEEAKRAMQAAWEGVEKRYVAAVAGIPKEREGTLVHWLREDPQTLRVAVVPKGTSDGFRSVTHYQVLKSGNGRSLLSVRLETGRKHQIRAQFAAIGHPVLGDERYGNKDSARRLALHAVSLSFTHPVTGETMVAESPLPKGLKALV